MFNDLQATFLINMINSVLSGTSLQSALNTMQTAVNSDYASAKSGLG